MSDILTITGPICLRIALGWVATRSGLFERGDMQALSRFVLYVALPALLFEAVATRSPDDILQWRYMGVYAVGGLAVVAFGLVWTRRVARQVPLAATLQTMGMGCPSSGFVGYPINLLVLGMNMLVENLVLIPLLLAPADSAGGGRQWLPACGATRWCWGWWPG